MHRRSARDLTSTRVTWIAVNQGFTVPLCGNWCTVREFDEKTFVWTTQSLSQSTNTETVKHTRTHMHNINRKTIIMVASGIYNFPYRKQNELAKAMQMLAISRSCATFCVQERAPQKPSPKVLIRCVACCYQNVSRTNPKLLLEECFIDLHSHCGMSFGSLDSSVFILCSNSKWCGKM